ncbi:Ceramidase [compost metagenome]
MLRLITIVGSALFGAASVATTSFSMGPSPGGDWWTPLDHYCERVGPGFWAEPFNTLTNLGFVIAAAAIFVRQRRAGRADKQLLVLALLTASVGIGSFLFHTLANRWSLIADIVPIAVVIYSFFFAALTRLLRLSAIVAGLLTATLLVLSPTLEVIAKPLLGSSATYAPGLIATFGVAFAIPLAGRGSMPSLLVAAGTIFSAALVFRILDAPLCGYWSVGTHFIWHVLNAVALGFALLSIEQLSPGGRADSLSKPMPSKSDASAASRAGLDRG